MKKSELRIVEEPPLNALDRVVIGKAVRIEIPFSDLYKMRRMAEMLRGLADDIDFNSRRIDHPEPGTRDYELWRRHILFYLKFRTGLVNKEIRLLHGKYNRNGSTK